MNDNIALFLFDFDGTLVKKNLHNYIGERIHSLIYSNGLSFKTHDEYEQFIMKNSIKLTQTFLATEDLSWKNPEKIKTLMQEILKSKHKIGIVSFNNYPYAVKYAMEQLLGKEDAEEVYIKSGLPATDYAEIQKCNKVPYIKEVMRETKILNEANVFFMDDDSKNVIAAKEFGIQAVFVGKEGAKHIDIACKFLEEFNEKYEIYVDIEELPCSVYEANGIGFDPIYKDWADDGSKMLGNHY